MILIGMNKGYKHEFLEWSGTFQELSDSNMYPDIIWHGVLKDRNEMEFIKDIIINNKKTGEVWR
jgi:hypothetical protein